MFPSARADESSPFRLPDIGRESSGKRVEGRDLPESNPLD